MKPLEIKGARTRLGYSQQYMADELGMSVHSYQKKESGKIKFTETEKFKVGEMLELSGTQLMSSCLTGNSLNFFRLNYRLVMPYITNGKQLDDVFIFYPPFTDWLSVLYLTVIL